MPDFAWLSRTHYCDPHRYIRGAESFPTPEHLPGADTPEEHLRQDLRLAAARFTHYAALLAGAPELLPLAELYVLTREVTEAVTHLRDGTIARWRDDACELSPGAPAVPEPNR